MRARLFATQQACKMGHNEGQRTGSIYNNWNGSFCNGSAARRIAVRFLDRRLEPTLLLGERQALDPLDPERGARIVSVQSGAQST